MSNPQIELVKKWLANPESVSLEELDTAVAAANTDYLADYAANGSVVSYAGDYYAAYAAVAIAADAEYFTGVAHASCTGAEEYVTKVKHYIEEYEERTK